MSKNKVREKNEKKLKAYKIKYNVNTQSTRGTNTNIRNESPNT